MANPTIIEGKKGVTIISNYFDDAAVIPKYGREVYIKHLPPNLNQTWFAEYLTRFGRPVQIRYYKDSNEAHVKFMSFEEACTAVECIQEHVLADLNGIIHVLNVVHSRDYPFLVFGNFHPQFDMKDVHELFYTNLKMDKIVNLKLDMENREATVEFNDYEYARMLFKQAEKSRDKSYWIAGQPLKVRWQRINALVVLGIKHWDSNDELKTIFQDNAIYKIVRKHSIAYTWFHSVEAAKAAMKLFPNGQAVTPRGTPVLIEWMGKEVSKPQQTQQQQQQQQHQVQHNATFKPAIKKKSKKPFYEKAYFKRAANSLNNIVLV